MARYNNNSTSRGLSTKSIAAARKKYIKKRSKSGPGYSTSRAGSDDTFQIKIDFADFSKSMNESKKYLTAFINDAYGKMRKKPNENFKNKILSFNIEPNEKGVVQYKAEINSVYNSQKFIDSIYNDFAPDIGRIGVDNVRDGIRNPEEPPISFRYDTGLMYNSVDFRRRKTASSVVIDVGWTRKFYKYFDFQERGTKHIGGMRAIRNGYRKTVSKSQDRLLQFMRNYSEKNGFSGKYRR